MLVSLRFHNNKFLFLKDHLDRLYDDAKKLSLKFIYQKNKFQKYYLKQLNK